MEKFKVGGAVRDELMGLTPKDIDYVVVGSTPEEMLVAGFKQVGADFPVFLDAEGVEYALARTERKSGSGYNGFVTEHNPSITLEDDLLRRDLTINAMAIAADGSLIDPYGGQADIASKTLRHVSEAFADDPVRVLRLARLHARYGSEWTVDESTVKLCHQMAESGELDHLTSERVMAELEKVLSEPNAHVFFYTLRHLGALHIVFPELKSVHDTTFETLLSSEDKSVKMKFAAVMASVMDWEPFAKRLRASTDYVRYTRMVISLQESHVNSDHVVVALHKAGAYRNKDQWEEIAADFRAMDWGIPHMHAFDVTSDIGFDDLSAWQQANCVGPHIGTAILEKRMAVYDKTPIEEETTRKIYVGVLHNTEVHASYPYVFGVNKAVVQEELDAVVDQDRKYGCAIDSEIFVLKVDIEMIETFIKLSQMDYAVDISLGFNVVRDDSYTRESGEENGRVTEVLSCTLKDDAEVSHWTNRLVEAARFVHV